MPTGQDKDPESPATTSEAYDLMLPRWAKMDVVLGGTESMREAGRDVLIQHERESDVAYEERREAATLFNMLDRTLQSLVGRPFSDPVVLNDDIPGQLRSVLETDIDGLGNNVQVFAREWFSKGLAKAFAHILIDVPPAPTPAEGENVRTLRDDQGREPYWILLEPENVIFMSSVLVNGREVLEHVRIKEVAVERVGFAFEFKLRIRVIELGETPNSNARFQVWQLEKKTRGKEKWVIIEEGELGVPFIPLVTFYADRQGLGVGKPPLLDLADLNIKHYQSESDQDVVLTVARFPILAATGSFDDSEGVLEVGPKKILVVPDPNGDLKYVEHTGAAIEAGQKHGERIEEQMEAFGAEFLVKRPGSETATARALDSAEATSPLQDMTIRFMDAFQTALSMTAQWLNLGEEGGTIGMSMEFGPEESDASDQQTLDKANTRGVISDQRFTTELQRRGILSDDFDFEEDQAILDTEREAKMALMPDVDPLEDDEEEEDDQQQGAANG